MSSLTCRSTDPPDCTAIAVKRLTYEQRAASTALATSAKPVPRSLGVM
jgi:hypothetical protein